MFRRYLMGVGSQGPFAGQTRVSKHRLGARDRDCVGEMVRQLGSVLPWIIPVSNFQGLANLGVQPRFAPGRDRFNQSLLHEGMPESVPDRGAGQLLDHSGRDGFVHQIEEINPIG
jgi:hypothetical protein